MNELVEKPEPDVPPSRKVADVPEPSHSGTVKVAEARLDAASVIRMIFEGAALFGLPSSRVVKVPELSRPSTRPPT